MDDREKKLLNELEGVCSKHDADVVNMKTILAVAMAAGVKPEDIIKYRQKKYIIKYLGELVKLELDMGIKELEKELND